jgi:hypothetical protein
MKDQWQVRVNNLKGRSAQKLTVYGNSFGQLRNGQKGWHPVWIAGTMQGWGHSRYL